MKFTTLNILVVQISGIDTHIPMYVHLHAHTHTHAHLHVCKSANTHAVVES